MTEQQTRRPHLPPFMPDRHRKIAESMGAQVPLALDNLTHMWADGPATEAHPEGTVTALCGGRDATQLAGHWDVINCPECRAVKEGSR